MAAAAGPLALVGSGEFLPVMRETDARLLDGRPPRVAVVPTAASPEGDASVRRWFGLAHEHYAALDAEVLEVDVRDRADADDDGLAARVAGCGLVYLSGGDPVHLATTLAGTRLWSAIRSAWLGGTALAGCSAGAMAMADHVLAPRWRRRDASDVTGLGVLPGLAVIPHFDRFGRLAFSKRTLPDGVAAIGVDEGTALVWADGAWRVEGVGAVHHVAPSRGDLDPATFAVQPVVA